MCLFVLCAMTLRGQRLGRTVVMPLYLIANLLPSLGLFSGVEVAIYDPLLFAFSTSGLCEYLVCIATVVHGIRNGIAMKRADAGSGTSKAQVAPTTTTTTTTTTLPTWYSGRCGGPSFFVPRCPGTSKSARVYLCMWGWGGRGLSVVRTP